MARFKFRSGPEYPCAVATCPATVPLPGQKCSVHKAWNEGPYDHPCVKCRQPIVRGDHWQHRNGDIAMPVHSQCVGGKRASRTKKSPGLFDEVTA